MKRKNKTEDLFVKYKNNPFVKRHLKRKRELQELLEDTNRWLSAISKS